MNIKAPAYTYDDDILSLEDLHDLQDYAHYNKHIYFSKLTHPWFKPMAKDYLCYLKNQQRSIGTLLSYMKQLVHLDAFLQLKKFPNMRTFNHNDTLSYIHYLNTLRPNAYFITRHISNLSCFTQWGAWFYPNDFPSQPIIEPSDRPKIVRREPRYYTKEDIKKIKSVLPYTDKITARITLVMIHTGARFGDIARTPLNIAGRSCLTQTPDGQYIFEIYMSKTKRYNRIPVQQSVAQLIQAQINSTIKKYGNDCKCLFATSKTKGYYYDRYTYKMRNLVKKYNLTSDDGKPLQINTRLFRSTLATNLINNEVSPDVVRSVLGHKTVYTQMHYATIHGATMLKYLAPLTNQDNELIKNIGNITESMCHIPDDFTDFIPLPNGSCTHAGDCPHQNACYTCSFYVPQKKFLPTYKLQLEQAELAIAEAQKYNHTAFLEKNKALRNSLITLIKTLEDFDETGQHDKLSEEPFRNT